MKGLVSSGWRLHHLDALLVVIGFALVGLLRADYALIAILCFAIAYLYLSGRPNLLAHLLLAGIVALLWSYISKPLYAYNQPFITLFGLIVYPILAWTLGLFALYLLYTHLQHRLSTEGFLPRLGLFVSLYWPLLIITEAVGYHLFTIHNLATSVYAGLPICDCMHAPPPMQAMYFALGIIYFILCWASGLERPARGSRF